MWYSIHPREGKMWIEARPGLSPGLSSVVHRGDDGRCAGGVLKPATTLQDSISRIPYGVSTAWDKGRVSDANCKLRS